MAAHEGLNGPVWPQLDPVAPPIDELPENPTQSQVLKALISTLLAFGHLWPRCVQALLYLKAAIEQLKVTVDRIDRAQRGSTSTPPSDPNALPPMRRTEDSSAHIAETSHRVGEAAKYKAQQIIDSPGIDLTPDAVADIARTEAREALEAEREANRVRLLEASVAATKAKEIADAAEAAAAAEKTRLLAEKLAAEKRERNRLIVVGVVVGVVMLVIGTLYTFAQGRLAERASNAATTPASVPMLPVFIQVPSATPSASASATPTKKP